MDGGIGHTLTHPCQHPAHQLYVELLLLYNGWAQVLKVDIVIFINDFVLSLKIFQKSRYPQEKIEVASLIIIYSMEHWADLQAIRREVCILARGGVTTVKTAVVVTPHRKIRFPPYLQYSEKKIIYCGFHWWVTSNDLISVLGGYLWCSKSTSKLRNSPTIFPFWLKLILCCKRKDTSVFSVHKTELLAVSLLSASHLIIFEWSAYSSILSEVTVLSYLTCSTWLPGIVSRYLTELTNTRKLWLFVSLAKLTARFVIASWVVDLSCGLVSRRFDYSNYSWLI